MDIELSLNWKLGRDGAVAVSPTLFALLAAVRDQGSISRAAVQVHVSYRSAWNMLRAWSVRLEQPLVHMRRGRGTRLTPFGEKLLRAESRVRDTLAPTLAALADELRVELDTSAPGTSRGSLVVYASHSLTHELLRDLLREQACVELELHHHGSLESLGSFNDKRCDLAGFHIVDGELRSELADRYRPLLDARRFRLISVATRRQGLMVAPGNPENIRVLGDLARAGRRFVNRQSGSGTRLLLDTLLRRHGVDRRDIPGYANEEFTHSAVAALLASHSVDAGFGVEAAAARFGLDFIPFASESYYFAVRAVELDTPAVDALISVLASDGFRHPVQAMPGYDPSNSGTITEAVV